MGEIQIAGAVGRGSTEKSAFDDALHAIGVSHCNLIGLSSVVPEGSGPIIAIPAGGTLGLDVGWGDRLYCVIAQAECRHDIALDAELDPVLRPPRAIAAGIGWARAPSGRGVFVEHVASARSELDARFAVETDIASSLDEMLDRRGWHAREVERGQVVVAGGWTDLGYTCALVVAAIEHAPWQDVEEIPI